MIIAVDFDGTLFSCYGVGGTDQINVPNSLLIEACKRWKKAGHTLILWTCRDKGLGLEEALELLKSVDLEFPYVNQNCQEVLESRGDRRKIVADIYIDDRAVMMRGGWEEWIKTIFLEHGVVYR